MTGLAATTEARAPRVPPTHRQAALEAGPGGGGSTSRCMSAWTSRPPADTNGRSERGLHLAPLRELRPNFIFDCSVKIEKSWVLDGSGAPRRRSPNVGSGARHDGYGDPTAQTIPTPTSAHGWSRPCRLCLLPGRCLEDGPCEQPADHNHSGIGRPR